MTNSWASHEGAPFYRDGAARIDCGPIDPRIASLSNPTTQRGARQAYLRVLHEQYSPMPAYQTATSMAPTIFRRANDGCEIKSPDELGSVSDGIALGMMVVDMAANRHGALWQEGLALGLNKLNPPVNPDSSPMDREFQSALTELAISETCVVGQGVSGKYEGLLEATGDGPQSVCFAGSPAKIRSLNKFRPSTERVKLKMSGLRHGFWLIAGIGSQVITPEYMLASDLSELKHWDGDPSAIIGK